MMIAQIEVAAACRCVNPIQTSAGTMTVPPPMPNMPENRPAMRPTARRMHSVRRALP